MKAIVLKMPGPAENLTVAEVPTPEVKKGEVLVKVSAISVNPVDALLRQNSDRLHQMLKPVDGKDTYIIGWDISGTVVQTGPGVTGFREGDEVFGMVNFPGNGKAYAEYVAAPAEHLAYKPGNISHAEAAGATLAALTAWQALVEHAKIKKGEKILIHAASGGVGHYAVQMAKHFGAYVVGTASASNRDFVLDLGADEFIDYTSEKFEEKIRDADIVLDSIPGDHLLRSINAVKEGGRVISIKGYVEGEVADKARSKNIYALRMMVKSNGEDMQKIARLLDNSEMRSVISLVFSFTQMPEAHKQIETSRTRGKIIVLTK